jgi:hypothetical protein
LSSFASSAGGWTAAPADADRYLAWLRRERQLAAGTVAQKAWALSQFFEFLLVRYQGDIHALTGHVLVQPIDEFNRPAKPDHGIGRVPPSTAEVELLFTSWRDTLPDARKYLPATRDYFAASLWRRLGLRISESAPSMSVTGARTWASTAPCISGSARAAAAAVRKPGWCRASTDATRCCTGGSPTCGTNSATTGTTLMRRCCPANDVTQTPVCACGWVPTRCALGWLAR